MYTHIHVYVSVTCSNKFCTVCIHVYGTKMPKVVVFSYVGMHVNIYIYIYIYMNESTRYLCATTLLG